MRLHFSKEGPPVNAENLRNPAPFPFVCMQALGDIRFFRGIQCIGQR